MKAKQAAEKQTARKASSALGLSDDFRAWVVESLFRGEAPDEIVSILVEEARVPRAVARREVAALRSSPALDAARRLYVRAQRLSAVLELQGALAHVGPSKGAIERRSKLTAAELMERYFAANRPVIVTDVVTRWPAFGKWSPAFFRERYGDVELEIMGDRDADPEPDMNFERHRRKTTMRAYVDRVLGAGSSNDFYLVAHNHAPENPGLLSLSDDVIADPELFHPDRTTKASSLWFGPKGTVTPLHHDTTNVFFGQLFGRKRFRLVPPTVHSLLLSPRGVYGDPELPLPPDEVREVILEPGEALFIPVGWWHSVVALDVSISFSLMGFRAQNDWETYKPGSLG